MRHNLLKRGVHQQSLAPSGACARVGCNRAQNLCIVAGADGTVAALGSGVISFEPDVCAAGERVQRGLGFAGKPASPQDSFGAGHHGWSFFSERPCVRLQDLPDQYRVRRFHQIKGKV